MSRHLRRTGLCMFLGAVIILVMTTPAFAVRVGWNVDVHQGKFGSPTQYCPVER